MLVVLVMVETFISVCSFGWITPHVNSSLHIWKHYFHIPANDLINTLNGILHTLNGMQAVLGATRTLLSRPSGPQIQVLSDLHLELGQQYSSFTFPACAPFLLLGGDVGRLIDYDAYLKFLEAQVCRFEKVFLVLGNHEFYGRNHETGLETARRLIAEPSLAGTVILLHRMRWDDPDSDLTILGCTLWSAVSPKAADIVQAKVKDYTNIEGWTVEKHNSLHAEDAAWLRAQVSQISSQKDTAERRILLATHHAPSIEGTSRPEQSKNPWTCAFATDLLSEGVWDGVKVWVFGHTHYSTDVVCNGVRMLANQRGYVLGAKEDEKREKSGGKGFDETMVITV